MRSARLVQNTLLYLCGIALAFYILAPFVWGVIASIQLESDLFVRPMRFIPERPTIENYLYVFTGAIPQEYAARGLLRSPITQEARVLPQGLVNSFTVALTVTVINLIFGTLAAYTFARERFRGKGAAYLFILGSRLLPAVAVAIPIYIIIKNLDLLDTKLGLILLYSAFTLPFTIWVLTLYFQALPREIEDAAFIDGCGRFSALVRIVVPIAAPGLAAVGAFAFLFSYNEFLFALFTTQTTNAKTIPVMVAAIGSNPDASYTLIAVGITLSLLAPIALALLFRRYIVSGMVTSFGR
jgi:multiple sugar transport system permease protein